MRRYLLLALTFVAFGMLAGSAQAVVIDMGSAGHYGVALVPGTRSTLTTAGISTVAASAPCGDPALAPDFVLQSTGLCFHGGSVMHGNAAFAVTWDPHRVDWQTTRDYVEHFLKDVADGSGTLSSPYALTGQYGDGGGRAKNASVYGGGCIDFGQPGGSSCKFASSVATGPGHNDAGSDCPVTGTNFFWQDPSGAFTSHPNDYCVTDSQLRAEVSHIVADMGLIGHTQPGHTPLVVLRTPPGVVTCVDAAGTLCSANGVSTAQFCSYHAQADVGGTKVAYVVAPWTALTGCDDLGVPALPQNPTAREYAIAIGQRLVSPLSQGQIASIVNPDLNGWYALDGSEINDNGCVSLPKNLDQVTVGNSGQNPYWLQREFNNAGAIVSDPNAPKCAPSVDFAPTFVVPSPINAGDVVAFDGSVTPSTLLVPQAGYVWSFGDGTGRQGASVVHTYARGRIYTVRLTVTDRGGNVSTVTQPITVLGSGGQTPTPTPTPKPKQARLQVGLQLLPQGLKSMLRSGVALRVSSNQPADGISTLSISRRDARRAHIRTGRGATVVIGRGTVAGIKNGTMRLHLRLSRDMTKKLGHLAHLKLTVRLALTAASGDHTAIDAAGSY